MRMFGQLGTLLDSKAVQLYEYYTAIKKQVVNYLHNKIHSSVLQENVANLQYKKLLHNLGTYKEDVWSVISPLKQQFDKKIYSIVAVVSQDPSGIRKVLSTLISELRQKAQSNEKSVDRKFGKETANDLFEYLQGRRSDFSGNIAKMIAEKEEIRLNEESMPQGKNAISSAILETSICSKQIAQRFFDKTPCGEITDQYSKLINPDKWIRRMTADVFDFVINHSEENVSDEFEDRIYFRIQDIVGEMILTIPVWLLTKIADELKFSESQIITEIFLVSMISPDNLVLWDKLFRRMGIGSITLRIGKVLKYINK